MAAHVLRRSLIGARGVLRLSQSSPPLLRTQNQFPLGLSGFSSDVAVETYFSDEESKRGLFNRLLYRSRQRGFLELDLVLGCWVKEHIHSMDANGVKALIGVLDLENPDLWKWLTDQEQPPAPVRMNPVFSAIRDKVMENLSNSAPETRAVPGKPWVRGWDDFKKRQGAPVAGNQ